MARRDSFNTIDYPLSRSPLLRNLSETADYQPIDWEASRDAQRERALVWPFESVTRVEAMLALEHLINVRNDAQYHCVDGKRKSAAAVADNITASTYAALKVCQEMERESKQFELDSYKNNLPFKARYDIMEAMVKRFSSDLAKHNNEACGYISEELADKHIVVPYIDREEEQYKNMAKLSYMSGAEERFARRAADEHYRAASALYKDIREIISSGVYGDDLKTRIAAKFNCTNNDTQMKRMQDLVSAEAKIDIINKWIIPELEKQQIENQLHAHMEENRNKELPVEEQEWYFKNLVAHTDNQIQTLKDIISDMRKQEKEMLQDKNCTIGFKYNAKSKTVDVALEYDSDLANKKQPRTPKLNKKGEERAVQAHFETTKEKDHKKQNLLVKIGITSNSLYEQTKETLFKKWGFKNDMGMTIFKRGARNELEVSAGTYQTKSTVKTKMSDRAGMKASVKASLLKIEDNIYLVAKDKDYKALGLTGNLGGGSFEFDKTKLIPTIKIGAFIAEVEGKALNDKLKAKGTAGSLNITTDIKTNIMRFIQGVDKDMGKTMRNEEGYKDKTIIDAVKNSAKSVIGKITNPKFSTDPTLKVSVMDYALFESKFNGQEVETYNAIKNLMSHPHVQQFANNIVVPVTTMLPVAQMANQADTVLKTACARFAVNGNLIPSQIKPDAIVFVERDGQPMICRINDLESGDKIMLPSQYLENSQIHNDVFAEVQEVVQTGDGVAIVTDEMMLSNEDFSLEYQHELETVMHEPVHQLENEQEKEPEIEEEQTEEYSKEFGE